MQKRTLLLITLVSLIVIGGLLTFIYIQINKNPYGDNVAITNYDEKVKNLPKAYKDSITAALYKMVVYNAPNQDIKVEDIGKGTVRDTSNNQDKGNKDDQYSGTFIVDLEKIKQSYKVSYEYSKEIDANFVSGYPILVSCPSKDQLVYGDFDCKEILARDIPKVDPIVARVPYANLSFSMKANTTSGTLVLDVELRIPESDLKGNDASRRQVVTMYKKEVTTWIEKQGLNPSTYSIQYNYNDDGSKKPAQSEKPMVE